MKPAFACTAIAVLALLAPTLAQNDGFDEEAVALTYHKVSGDPIDLARAAEQADAVMRASGFDRPDVVKAQMARLQDRLSAASAATEFVISVNTAFTQYDHELGEFSIQLFTPGHYVPLDAFRQQYRLVFANADRARRVPMPKEAARAFDARLNSMGRSVTSEIRFRVVGKGDPAGAVADGLVVRAEIVSVRLLDAAGNIVFTPDLSTASPAEINTNAFDAAKADVAGLRVGVSAADLEATLTRLFGKVLRGSASNHKYARFAGTLEMNSNGCYSVYGRRNNPGPGTVCITAVFDEDEVVRSIRIERYFPSFDPDVLRTTLLKKYGPVAGAQGGRGMSLGWGPDVEGMGKALTASYSEDRDFMADAVNSRASNVRVSLQLIDAAWVAANRQ